MARRSRSEIPFRVSPSRLSGRGEGSGRVGIPSEDSFDHALRDTIHHVCTPAGLTLRRIGSEPEYAGFIHDKLPNSRTAHVQEFGEFLDGVVLFEHP